MERSTWAQKMAVWSALIRSSPPHFPGSLCCLELSERGIPNPKREKNKTEQLVEEEEGGVQVERRRGKDRPAQAAGGMRLRTGTVRESAA